ncbi:MAG: CDP-alcohol phosphatidyltransferase family protein [Myxococcales bacterium]|nr:CDP-alcohol phosphatidyltransferase family protein [Myxococcales bacterium]
MLSAARSIYFATSKRHDQLFNRYCMRPLAALFVACVAKSPITPNQLTLAGVVVFAAAAFVLIASPTHAGALVAVLVIEVAYLLDCADGMLARHKKIASQVGHLFDFFTDELKAVMLTGALGVHLYRRGGLGFDGNAWTPHDPRFLLATVLAVGLIGSATSLTNFTRRPELTGKETPVEAHYETLATEPARSAARRVAGWVKTFLQFLTHYPSHIYLFALAGRLDVFFWLYALLNGLYLASGWLGLFRRFGRFSA